MMKSVGKAICCFGILLAGFILTTACAVTPDKAQTHAAFIQRPADYQKLGLSPSEVKPWEDGLRTTGVKGNFEWWYFDAKFNDGSTLVIVFHAKSFLDVRADTFEPVVTFDLTRPDGTVIHKQSAGDVKFAASQDHCDVRIGDNTFTGNLRDYTIHIEMDNVKADLQLHATVPSWRPGTGIDFFEHENGEYLFGWLVSVPKGRVEGNLVIDGRTQSVSGSGYHDHNWGETTLLSLLDNWYWGRAEVGHYTVITAFLTATEKYRKATRIDFMLAYDDKIIGDNDKKVHYSVSDVYTDPLTGKPVANVIVYEYKDGPNHYRITYNREKDILRARFVDYLDGIKYVLARLLGFDSAYLRFAGKVKIEKLESNQIIETASNDSAVWELMYLGHAPEKKP